MFVLCSWVTLISFRLFILNSKKIRNYFEFGPFGDASIYLQMIQHYRKSDDKSHDDRLLLTQNLHFHPNLYEKIIGFLLQDKFIERYSWAPNFLIYCIGTIFFILFMSSHGVSGPSLLLISFLFLTQAENFGYDFNRIHYLSLQPRYLGLIVCSFFWLLYCFIPTPQISIYLICFIAISFFAWNISKFSQQSLFFSSLIFSLLNLDFTSFICVLIGFGINFVVNWPRNSYMLREQINFYKWKLSERHPITKDRGKLIEAISNYLVPQARGIISYPIFIGSIFYGCFYYSDLSSTLKNILILNVGNFILYVLFSTRLLSGLGEGWRYISFSSYLTTPIFFVLAFADDSFAILKIFLLAIASIILISRNKSPGLHNRNEVTYKIFDACKKYFNKDSVIVGIPYYTTIPLLTSYRVNKIVSHQLGDLCDSFVKKYMVSNNFLQIDKDLIKRHSITHILFDEKHLQYNKREDVADILNDAYLVYSLDGMHLYAINANVALSSLQEKST